MAWTFRDGLKEILEKRDLASALFQRMFEAFLNGECNEIEAAAFLTALRARGESAEELAAAACLLRQRMTAFETGALQPLDTCGTGGDGSLTFNISTAAAIVLAAAGVPIVKHGNRSFSSRTGSSDVLRELGIALDETPDSARDRLKRLGIAFCFAPRFHPVLARWSELRKSLGFRTVLNCLGPLANPAQVPFQVLGVGQPHLLDPMAGALARLGIRRAFVLCAPGFDEVSLSGPTEVREVRGREIVAQLWTPRDFGLPERMLEELRVSDVSASAKLIESILRGEKGPGRDVVLANAAVGLLLVERVPSLRDGVAEAERAVDAGLAAQLLARLREAPPSRDFACEIRTSEV